MKITRRSKLERLIDILRVVNIGPIRQTHIMYKANITWNELRKDISWLRSLGLIKKKRMREGVFYEITSSGLETLSFFEIIESKLNLKYGKLPEIQYPSPYVR